MILLCSVLLVFSAYFTRQWYKTRYLRRLEEAFGDAGDKETNTLRQILSEISVPSVHSVTKTKVLLAIPPAIIGSLVSLFYFHTSFVFGFFFGGLAPFLVMWFVQYKRKVAYRNDAKMALEFAGSVFAAGGTVEDWIRECTPYLQGPLHAEFAQAVVDMRQNIPVSTFLARLAEKSPDPFFRWALAGVLSNITSAGNLQKFISEVMDDLAQQERLERRMRQEQKNFSNMMSFMVAFPVAMYFLFRNTVDELLQRYWEANIVLLAGMIGYLLIFIFASRIARPKMLE